MCGIYGTTKLYNKHQILEKLKRTDFRGPDQTGYKEFGKTAGNKLVFGHNRLSIIDLDPRSNQPFSYEKDVHMVFNGEIYNFKSIKKTLVQKGYTFLTSSDTEVITAAYLEYGKKCVDHFVGMFSFVIYDERKQILFGARDRLGQKPFYYYHNNLDFEFSSQLSPIALHNKDLTVSNTSISLYLAWNNVPDPHSIFKEVKKLKAGHCFEFNLGTGDLKSWQYWDIDHFGNNKFKGSYNDAMGELEQLLNEAVSQRLYADVPVGVFLSGGVDSSLIASLSSKTIGNGVKTFSVRFNEKRFDESEYAKKVADHLKTEHHIIDCNYNDGLELIENFCHYYDEPFADSSAIPTMLLSKHTRKHVTVALSGDGGDESFIGYQRYLVDRREKAYKIPLGVRKLVANVLSLSSGPRSSILSKSLKFKSFEHFYLNLMTQVDRDWMVTDIDPTDVHELRYLFHNKKGILERLSDFDIKTYLNWDINTKVDRASMAFSLEARAPLMDHRVVEFARSLPTAYKCEKTNQKRILKDILYKYVPKEIFDRPKAGFTMPFAEWFRNDLKTYVLDELSMEGLNRIPNIDAKRVHHMIDMHIKGEWDYYRTIWKLLVLKQWLNKFDHGR